MAIIPASELNASLGALIIGGMVCTGLTGVVGMQTALYFRMFMRDLLSTKLKVAVVFLLDLVHTFMVGTANYLYFVNHFGDRDVTDRAFWAVGISIALTAVLTVFVHFHFANRLFKLSKGNYWITVPILVLATMRLAAALVTTVELTRIGSFREFGAQYRWVFTLGLVLSFVVDFLITTGQYYYLRRSRTGSGRFDHILDSVALYTVETGLLTSVTTLVSVIFWLAMPHVLIYLGLHFAISKLYANSFLASMNTRQILRAQSQSHPSNPGHPLPVIFASRGNHPTHIEPVNFHTAVQITVDKTVEYDRGDGIPELNSPIERKHDRKHDFSARV